VDELVVGDVASAAPERVDVDDDVYSAYTVDLDPISWWEVLR